jgi:hypothetical protein
LIKVRQRWREGGCGRKEKGMGEVEKTLARLNKVLVEAGFPTVEVHTLGRGKDCWYQHTQLILRFDNDGKFIAPEVGEYR